jgi:hypothetical protein
LGETQAAAPSYEEAINQTNLKEQTIVIVDDCKE